MSVLQVYMSWANTVLQETGSVIQEIIDIQHGRVLCQLIDILDETACLQRMLECKGSVSSEEYVTAAVDHMRQNGIKVSFTVQDLLDKDVKSMLDALWQIILNYGIHPIDRTPQQRSVGVGKKHILEWCQKELEADFDPKNTIAYNLCTGDWFVKLLQKHSGLPPSSYEDKTEQVKDHLEGVEQQHHIRQDIINPSEVVDGTIDEHNLMIYISLLQRKIEGGHHTSTDRIQVSNQNAFGARLSEETELKDTNQEQKEPLSVEVEEEEEEFGAISGSGSPFSANSVNSPKQVPDSPPESKSRLNIHLQRPRSHRLIMAEAKEKLESDQRRREQQEEDRQRKERYEEITRRLEEETRNMHKEPKTPSDEELEDVSQHPAGEPLPMFTTLPPQYVPGLGRGVPIFVMQGQGHEAMMLFHALRQARHDANFHDPSTNGVLLEQDIPKLDTLLNLDGLDDSPSVTTNSDSESARYHNSIPSSGSREGSPRRDSPRKESPRRESPRRESPRRESPRRESPRRDSPLRTPRQDSPSQSPRRNQERLSYSPSRSPEFQRSKRGILEVVNDPMEPRPDLSGSESDGRSRIFPRVNITEPLKEIIKKDKESGDLDRRRDRSKSPKDRDRSKSPKERRALQEGSDLYTESSARSDDSEETNPKSILRKKDKSSHDGSYRYDDERSARSMSPPSQRSYNESARSPPYRKTSPDRQRGSRSPREQSPSYSRDRYSGDLSSSVKSLSDLEDRDSRSHTPTSPGRSIEDPDPDRRLVRVLNRELELLRLKMDVIERANASDDTDLEDINKVTQKLSEKVKDSLNRSTMRRKSPEPRSGRKSPDDRGRMFRRRVDDSSPVQRSKSENRSSKSYSPERTVDNNSKSYSLHDLSIDSAINEAADGKMTFSPRRRGRPINLGYVSPIRKVSEEIWGIDSPEKDSIDETNLEKWKKLTRKGNITEQEMVELKHALASIISDNDILQAKLKNSNAEVSLKMSKTNDVLNDCRSHLAKSQAENMELRTQLEKERIRNETLEERIREGDKNVKAAKSSNDDLEAELEQVRGMLKGMSKKDLPTLQGLMDERDSLLGVLSNTQKENTELLRDYDYGKKQYMKLQNTVNDLRKILDDAICERRQLYEEIQRLQEEGHLSQVSGIIAKYMEKGIHTERPNGFVRSRSSSRSSPVPYNIDDRPASPQHETVESIRARFQDVPIMSSSPNKSFNVSKGRSMHSTPMEDREVYNYEDISPSVPSNFREIYPHRKTRSYRNHFTSSQDDGRRSPSDFFDDMEVQKLMSQQPVTRLDFDKDLDDSYIQRTPRRDFHRSRSPDRSKSPGALKLSDLEEHRPRRYSPFNSTPVNKGYGFNSPVENIMESPIDNKFQDKLSTPRGKQLDIGRTNAVYLKALTTAVQNENGRSKCFDDFDIPKHFENQAFIKEEPFSASYGPSKSQLRQARSQSPGIKGILKNSKSEHNKSIKESSSPRFQRSAYSHSASPVRSPRSLSPARVSPLVDNPSHKGGGFNSTKQTFGGKPLFSQGQQRAGIVRNPAQLFSADDSLSPRCSSPTTSRLQYRHSPLQHTPLLSDEDRTYADLLIAKYTGRHGFGKYS